MSRRSQVSRNHPERSRDLRFPESGLPSEAASAIEDTATLTLLLRSGELDAALSRYDKLRRTRTRAIWRQSRQLGKIAQASHPIGAGIRDTLLRATPLAFMGRATQSIQRWTEP